MNKFLDSITAFATDTEKVIDLVIGVAVFLILFLFRYKISNALINVFGKLFLKNNKEEPNSLVTCLPSALA